MPYPRLLKLSEDIHDRLVSYLKDEIDNHEMERGPFLEDLKTGDRLYQADSRLSSTDAKMPLQQGATIIIPVVAIAVEMLQAKMLQKLFGLEQFTSIKLVDQWSDIDTELERTLDHEFIVAANINQAATDAGLEFLKYGTGILKTGYEFKLKRSYINDESESVVVKKGLCIDYVPVSDFLMPYSATSIENSPWCGEAHSSTPYEIKQLCNSDFFSSDTYFKLLNFFNDLNSSNQNKSVDFLRHKEKVENREPIWPKRVHWYEIWLAFDVDGDDKDEEIVVYYHRDSNTLLGARYNDRVDLSRPYHIKSNFPVEGRWYGIGQCKMGEQFQVEITTQHRQRIDAAAISILRMFKAKKGSGISPDEPIFAGKIWMLDELNDLEIFQSGEVYPSAYQNEQSAIMFWQQRSTVNELTLGMPQVGTPGTAASDMARIAEGNMRFDYTFSRFKSLISEACLDGICIVGKYGLSHEMLYEYLPNGQRVKEFLNLPPKLIKDQIVLTFRLAGQSSNVLLDRANWTQLGGMLTQYYTNVIQIASQLGDQQLLMVVSKKAIIAATEVMRQVAQSFDLRNIDKIVLTPQEISNGVVPNTATAIPGIAGILPTPGQGFVNPINTLPGGV